MKLCHVTIMVKDMEESMRFYHDLVGLPVRRRFSPAPGNEIVFLGDSETDIELIFNKTQTDVHFGKDISLGFEVASVRETMDLLRQNGIEAGAVSQPNPHIKYFFVSDPNGVRIQFVEYVN